MAHYHVLIGVDYYFDVDGNISEYQTAEHFAARLIEVISDELADGKGVAIFDVINATRTESEKVF